MDKINKESLDLTRENVEKLKELFPNIITDGKIDFDQLKSVLGEEIDESNERYQFTWNGKKDSIKLAQTASTATLRPSKDDSFKWDITENLYIEGDNLEVLKQLQKTYFGKIKMIYIDPPYNTGGDFVYKDNFRDNIKNYKELTNQQLRSNPETSGRYHTDWLNMMYPRLMLARNLLSEDGVIFVSIDDNEVENLKKMMNEIFGESNFISVLSILTGASQNGDGVIIQKNYESCIVFSKNLNTTIINKVDKAEEKLRNLSDAPTPLITRPDMGYTIYYHKKSGDILPKYDYDKDLIKLNDEKLVYHDDQSLLNNGYIKIRPGFKNKQLHRWRWGFDTFQSRINEIVIKEINGEYNVYFMQSGYNPPKNIHQYSVGTNEVKKLFDDRRLFDYPKSIKFIKYLSSIASLRHSIILDFFSGSATTAHAVMKLNAEDGGNRKFIMVQLPEKTDESSEAYKAGYENICEIGKERIRRAGKQIKDELEKEGKDTSSLDIGFKVFKLDETNIKEWDAYEEVTEQTLFNQEQILKDGRTKDDLLYEILLKYGVFDKKVNEIKVNNKTMYSVGENSVILDLNDSISLDDVKAITQLKPMTVIFYEDGFEDDNVKINAEVILKDHGVEDVRSV